MSRIARFDMTEQEWRTIKPLLPNKSRGVPRVDDQRVLNGIFYRLRTGIPWRDLPECYGPYTTVLLFCCVGCGMSSSYHYNTHNG